MNAFKKWLRNKQGVKLECDYPYVPYGDIISVEVSAENLTVWQEYTYGIYQTTYDRQGHPVILDNEEN